MVSSQKQKARGVMVMMAMGQGSHIRHNDT
jgi:hypothetical protein